MRTIRIFIFSFLLSLCWFSNYSQTWSPVGTGVNNYVSTLSSYNSELYACGNFTTAGGNVANYIASWNGSTWSPVGTGTDWRVKTSAVYNGELVAGGMFGSVGGLTPAGGIGSWNGAAWSTLGTGMMHFPGNGSGFVYALADYNAELYAGGDFGTAGGNSVHNIAKWNGITWSTLTPVGMDYYVWALAVYNNDLFIGGAFTNAGGISATYIAKWNGVLWSTVGTGTNNSVNCFAIYNGELYVGGNFTIVADATSINANYIAKWNGTNWSTVGTGMDALVSALAVYNGELYAGGNFTTAGGISANHIAKWDGTNWSALGAGVNANVEAMTAYNSDLYVGGSFTSAGGAPANYIAKWNNPIGIKDLEMNNQINIYPNPATDEIYIEQMDKTILVEELTLIDVYGKKHKALMNDQNAIDISTLNSGIYILVLNTNKGKVRKKIIVQ